MEPMEHAKPALQFVHDMPLPALNVPAGQSDPVLEFEPAKQ
jgi:hypothetical protein